ncbi:ABC transporter substrate-binding protein [Chloroflexota bacterium]
MAKKIVWLVVSCLMVLSLVMASCGPAAEVEEDEGEGAYAPASEPKYGGTITSYGYGYNRSFDPTKAQAIRVGHMQLTSNELIQGDWTKGPQGSGDTIWDWGFVGDETLLVGELAESWEMPDAETIIWHIVEGAKFHDRAPVNGREVTAEDVAWSMMYQYEWPGTWQNMAYPPESGLAPTSFKALDKYTVEVKVPAKGQKAALLEMGENAYTSPPEVWIGDGPGEGEGMETWDKVIGSGPFLLTGHVSGTGSTYSKNPDYWEMDPLHPQNRLPYPDTVKILDIADVATRVTAFRTGKLDLVRGFAFEDALVLIDQIPEIQYTTKLGTPFVAAGRQDKPELPFDDIKVRQAMNLAVNQVEILEDYLQGEGALLGYPYHPTKTFEKMYTPMEEMPAGVKLLFTHDVDKAKELLAEAGYPDGFKTKIVVRNTEADEASMVARYLQDVGIDMELDVVEAGVWSSIDAANSQEEMYYGSAKGCWNPMEMLQTKTGMYSNYAIIDDPYYDDLYEFIGNNMYGNPTELMSRLKEAGVYELESAWGIWMPGKNIYNMWWPWMQNYYGIDWTGWAGLADWYKAVWIDEEMKAGMGY